MKDPALRAALDDAPKIGDSLCDDCRAHFAEVRARLDRLGVPYVLDPALVRGLDYYTRTTFEFMGPEENANSVICGGGRYDGLVEQIGGPATPGIGFGAGIERLLLALENENVVLEPAPLDVFVVVDGAEPGSRARAPAGASSRRPRGRHGLRRPVGEGTAHAGRAHRRGDARRARRRTTRRSGARERPMRRSVSQRSSLRSRRELARHPVRRATS